MAENRAPMLPRTDTAGQRAAPDSTGALPEWLQSLGHGIYAIDTDFHRARFDAAYLIVEAGRAAYVDSGTMAAMPRLLGALDVLGVPRANVDLVIPTHVHLDHAGACGGLMRECPNATMWVHPRGARHMIDPSALWAGATEVYGEAEMRRSYGEVVPVPAERVQSTTDGQTITLAGRPLLFIDTPGHAKHHHCIWDEASRGWFTGDTFGIAYPELDTPRGRWILPTSTPVQFDPPALEASVARLLGKRPVWMYLTHYGAVGGSEAEVRRLAEVQLGQMRASVELAQRVKAAPDRHEQLKQGQHGIFVESLRAHGSSLTEGQIAELLAVDLQLNAQGIAVWLDR